MWIGRCPEVEPDERPDGRGVCEVKSDGSGSDFGWDHVEGVGAEGTERKVLEGLVKREIPSETEGAAEKGLANVCSYF